MYQKLIDKIDFNKFVEKTSLIKKQYNISEEEAEQYLISQGPKKLTKLGVLDNQISWREGYTKQTLEKRKLENRKKKKMIKMSKRKQR